MQILASNTRTETRGWGTPVCLEQIPSERQPASWSWEQRPGEDFLRELGRPDSYNPTCGTVDREGRLAYSHSHASRSPGARTPDFSPQAAASYWPDNRRRRIAAVSSYANLVSSWALVPMYGALCRRDRRSSVRRYLRRFPDRVNWSELFGPQDPQRYRWNFFDSIRWIYRSMPRVCRTRSRRTGYGLGRVVTRLDGAFVTVVKPQGRYAYLLGAWYSEVRWSIRDEF